MPKPSVIADPAPVLALLDGFRKSQALFAALSLGVFDRLAQGPASASELAADLGADPSALTRLLNGCVCLGLVTRQDQAYANTPTAEVYLTSDSPNRLTGYARFSGAVLWKLWYHLADAVREGGHRWRQAFGLEGPIFSHFFRSAEDRREFLLGMHGMGQISSPEVVAAFDLGRFSRLADLGGATGHLAVAACRRYPRLRAVVFDLPEVVPLAQELIAPSGVADRVEVEAGDFFAGGLPQADLYALGRILHDWEDAKVRLLLGKIYARLPAGGALLVAEKLLDDDHAGPPGAVFQDLNMLACTEGRERTLPEYKALLHGAGFRQVDGRRTHAPVDAVLAVK